ncbi:60S acidic ribosomal protein P0 [Morella rubra]|uniref:60S acidic ribosomal protein P0 n=1 Tax=Morella rubra TaxID=262757 RepID=A0A6A1VD24_9ROSI|nr:60S acidic ribosomal protein P0 [Morella rubra]
MAVKRSRAEKKISYDKKLCALLSDYSQILVVNSDNVGSNQLQNIRQGLRGDSVVLMGKNTMMKRSIRVLSQTTGNEAINNLIPLLVVGAPARVGLVAPVDVVVPPGNTGLDPSQTSFFQVLNIPTKINKGTVEIITPVELIKKGDKVGSSEAALLAKLGIRPFSYGLVAVSVYDNGSVFRPEVLDLTEDDLLGKFAAGVSMVTSMSLAVSYPTLAAAPHMFVNAYKNALSIAVVTEYSFPHAEQVKEFLKDPSKFAVALAPVAAAESAAVADDAAKVEEKEEVEEESDDDMGNVGLIFTKGDLKEVREEVAKYKVGAPARVGLVAPVDVVVPPGNTGLDPSQTSFFQVLNIPTKINKGTVEIITPVELIKKGDKVGSSEAALLAKLGIRPFSYGLVAVSVYDNGSVFRPEVLDLTEDDLLGKFAAGVSMVTSMSLAVSYPTLAAAPHMFVNAYKNALSIAVVTEYSFPHAEQVKEFLKDPSKFAVALAPVAAAESAAVANDAAKVEEKEEVEEESDDDMVLNLFD